MDSGIRLRCSSSDVVCCTWNFSARFIACVTWAASAARKACSFASKWRSAPKESSRPPIASVADRHRQRRHRPGAQADPGGRAGAGSARPAPSREVRKTGSPVRTASASGTSATPSMRHQRTAAALTVSSSLATKLSSRPAPFARRDARPHHLVDLAAPRPRVTRATSSGTMTSASAAVSRRSSTSRPAVRPSGTTPGPSSTVLNLAVVRWFVGPHEGAGWPTVGLERG